MEINKKYASLLASVGTNERSIRSIANENDLQSIFYDLHKRVVSQAITEYFRGNPEENVFGREDWINGVKEYFSIGMPEIEDFDTNDLTIGDFNPQDFVIEEYLFKTDSQKLLRYRIRPRLLIDFFTNPAKVVSFFEILAERAVQRVKVFIFHQKYANLLGTSDKKITISFDKIVNTTGMDTQDVLKEMREQVISLQTPSHTHLVKPTGWTDAKWKKWVYSAKPENLIMVYNSKFYSGDLMKLTATLFNKNDVMLKLDYQVVDFTKIPNTTATETDKIKAFLIDKSALKIGYQVSEMTQQIQLPKFNRMFEYASFFGFARLRDFFIGVFQDGSSRSRRAVSKKKNTVEEKIAAGL